MGLGEGWGEEGCGYEVGQLFPASYSGSVSSGTCMLLSLTTFLAECVLFTLHMAWKCGNFHKPVLPPRFLHHISRSVASNTEDKALSRD